MEPPERRGARRSSPSANVNNNNNSNADQGHDQDLLYSLKQLSLSTSSTRGPSISPRSGSSSQSHHDREVRRSSISPDKRATPRSPVTRAQVDGLSVGARSSTPGLLRKASMNSLYSTNGGTPNRKPSRRGSSTSFLSPTATKPPTNPLSVAVQAPEIKPLPTPGSVARGYFSKELELLHGADSRQTAETVVILHDDCYGHRYSRPRASKSLLSTIVERPERIQASVLGVSMAYVRLGGRHHEGRHPVHPHLDPQALPSIPFRIQKTTRKVAISSTAVTNVHGSKWMEELKLMCDSAEAKLALNGNELRRPEMNRGPDTEPPQSFHQGDLYLCSESLNAFEGALGAVCEAVDAVFCTASPHRRAFVAIRPPGHHCSASFPSGFCWVNNVHVGIMHGILNHGLTHAAIIDFDLHHGDGSQAITWQHNKRGLAKNAAAWKKTSIGYFSVHDINSYPCEYGDEEKVKNASLCIDNAHGQNIWNVHLQEWKSDVDFWTLYQSKYSILLEKTRNYLRLQTERFRASGQVPKAAIFLSAGFDASEWEGVGMQRHKVNVPTEFYARLTRDVVRIAAEEGLGVEGRVISVLEGGYSDRALYSGVLSHLSGLAGTDSAATNLPHEIGNRTGPFSRRSTLSEPDLKPLKSWEFRYDPYWWSAAELDIFDATKAAVPAPEPKKPRAVTPGNYSSPTQSSNAKMTEVAKVRRSLSNLTASQTTITHRPPTPPPPDVPWTVAALELSKLLIPDNRQVESCKHSELNSEATKARRDRQSLQVSVERSPSDVQVAPAIPAAPTRMSLRERKPVSYLDEGADYKSRRRTVAGPAVSAPTKVSPRSVSSQMDSKQPRPAGRRLSAVSTAADISTPAMGPPLSRPTSSMSARTQSSTSLPTRRGRPAASRNDSGKPPRAPRKNKATVPKVEPGSSSADNGVITSSTRIQGGFAQSGDTASNTAAPQKDDLDQITSGMKKIKINVLTKEQKAAREKAGQVAASAGNVMASKAERSTVEEPPFSLAVVEAEASPRHGIGNVGDGVPATETKPEAETAIPTIPTVITPTEPSLPPTPFASSPPVQSPQEPVGGGDLPAPYQPLGPMPMPMPMPMQPAKFQSYSVPVSPVRRSGHGFTATSNIPFSPGPARSVSRDNVPLLPRPASKAEDVTVAWSQETGIEGIPESPDHAQ
ncbi:hypothetical protein GGS20DRAFT_588579 [Poronia punctata]|nr:hypothetical protein GGS20DRAFT_588579 [Poronia punctata]